MTRSAIDERFGLTAEEFRAVNDRVAIGPIYDPSGGALSAFIAELELIGLVYFEDFF